MTKIYCNKCEQEITEADVKGTFYCPNPNGKDAPSLLINVSVLFEVESGYFVDAHFCRSCLLKALTK